VAGIYIYPPDVFEVIRTLKPSRRGELEITDVNNHYLRQGRLGWSSLEGYWTDAGTPESLLHANELVRENPPLLGK
jgi:glucose-1-phosphate thymidylyltransferase